MASGGRPGVVSSGFFVGPGVVVTTGHGIEGATRRSIRRFPEGQRTPVLDLLGESRDHDLATLDVGSDVPAAPLRLSNRSARVGESVRVVWAKNSRTQRTDRAVVSRGEAFVRPWGVVFQIRASLELGCSGAPVLDDQGNVLGVVIAGSPTGGFFFAVPPRFVRELTDGITARSPVGITSPAPAVAPREAR
jgi:S1-C subfamily serine protease